MTLRSLLARVATDYRRSLVPLAVLAILNVAILALAVYPLSLKVNASQRRAAAADARLKQVQREVAQVHATLATTEQADKDLAHFYGEVLPQDVSAARRQTYAHLAELAETHNLTVTRRTYAIDDSYKGRLQRLQIAMVLSGEYPDVRDFIYALETEPEFVVIEDVSVAEGAKTDSGLTVNLQLATYFRGGGAHGS
jgi:Tfp pilus assembly protein PilO